MIRVLLTLLVCLAPLLTARAQPSASAPVQVAMLRYGAPAKTSICFAPSFLRIINMETAVTVDDEFLPVTLASDELFATPFAIMTGEGAFELSDGELRNLRSYLSQGGFILASAGCSSDAWAVSMRRAIGLAFPEAPLTDLALEHELFHTLYDIREFATRKRATVQLQSLELDGRAALVFSPQGLNDSAAAGVDDKGASCCCCNGDEILSAKFLTANILLYALTR